MATDRSTDPWEGLPVIRKTTRRLPVVLTDDDRETRGRELGLQVRSVVELEQMQKDVLKAFKQAQAEVMGNAIAERARLAKAVNEGEEPRDVHCVEMADYGKGLAYMLRADTSKLIGQRRLNEDEVQVRMAVPLRVVRNPDSGKLERADGGGDVDSMPFVRKAQCEPVGCRTCGERLGEPHDGECPLRGVGKAALVAEDQIDPLSCADCGAVVGAVHDQSCGHFEGGDS